MKVCSISYLNSIPFVYGLEHSNLNIQLTREIPSECANKLLNNMVDIALVPIAIIPQLPNFKIISSYGIASNGAVDTVCLFSQRPLNEIETIILDYHSRTSNELVKLLCSHYWKINPKFTHSDSEFSNQINDSTAGLIIGDRAYQFRSQFSYVYDLSEEWKKWTELPFVFACWVANKPVKKEFEDAFCEALEFGVSNLSQAISSMGHSFHTTINKKHYLTQVIDYHLDDEKRKAMNCYLAFIG
ncbi:MAG: menaquinone biosynthesis protein [Bacteroidota bacterium]|nr:menaquinone biosynthesis protein [Bacteroidota bacterium]